MNKRSVICAAAVMSLVAVVAVCPAAFAAGLNDMDDNTKMGLVIGILIVCASGVVTALTSRHFRKKEQQNKRRNTKKKKAPNANAKGTKSKKRTTKQQSKARAKNRR